VTKITQTPVDTVAGDPSPTPSAANTAKSAAGGGFGGIGRALALRDFRIYSIGNLTSLMGSWMHRMALGWLTWETTQSPAWLGAIAFCAMVPPIVLGPISGTIADRLGSRRTARTAMVCEAVNILVLAVLVASGHITIHLLLLLALLQGIFFAFDFPVRHALVPDLVPRSELSAAIAVNTATFHVTSFVGPVVGGFAIQHFGYAPAFLFNAFSYILFFFILRTLTITRESHAGTQASFLHDLADGFRYTFNHPTIRYIFIAGMATHVLMRPYYDLLPAFADQVFNRKIDGLTILASASGLGGLVAGIGLAVRGRMKGLTKALMWASVISSTFLAIFALMPYVMTPDIWLGFALLVPVGVGLVIAGISAQSLTQNVVDPAKRARVVGLSASFATGGPALGALILGWLGEIFGLGPPIAVTSLILVGVMLWAGPKLIAQRHDIEIEAARK
jgi:MFS family permease